MLEWALDERRILVGWNTVFDISWLYALAPERLVNECRFLDAMLLWRHLDIEPEYDESGRTKRSYSLKVAFPEFYPEHAGYEQEIDYHSTDPDELRKLHEYNVLDCAFTLRLAKRFWEGLKSKQQSTAVVEARCLNMVGQANLEGLIIDPLEVAQLSASLKVTAAKKLKSLAPHGISEEVVRSPAKLSKVMFDDWKLPVYRENESKKTGKVSRSTDKETLHELSFIDPRAKELREYREALNTDTKFAMAPIAACAYNEDGKAHPLARVFGTYSGRMTYSSKQGKNKDERQIGFALHQEKREAAFRRIVVPPLGYTLVEFDAAGQEFKLMAIASKDPVMLQLCQPGEDAHSFMGARVLKRDYAWVMQHKDSDPIAKNGRKSGKVANLCCSHSSPILTDRGHVAIQDVRCDDLIWDGIEFVAHDGVVFSGVREVVTHDGVTATPEHLVLVNQEWVRLDEAKRNGWSIQSSRRSTLRIVDGIVARVRKTFWREICAVCVCMRNRGMGALLQRGMGKVAGMQELCGQNTTRSGWASHQPNLGGSSAATEDSQLVLSVLEPERWIVVQLRRAWDRVSVYFGQGGGGVRQGDAAAPDLSGTRYRSDRQRWALRAGQPPVGHTQGEPVEQAWFQHGYMEGGIDYDAKLGRKPILVDLYDALCGARAFWRSYPAPRPRSRSEETQRLAQDRSEAPVYDIVNCGPRSRFSANGRIVHNSLMYRTSAPRLRSTARVDYGMPMTMDEARYIRKTYLQSYKRVPVYWSEQIMRTRQLGYVETFAGRRVKVQGDWQGNFAWNMGSTAINYRIQGTGADQKYLALMMLADYLSEIGARFALDFHDGLYFYVPDEKVYDMVHHTKDVLDNLPYEAVWKFKMPIPLTWDAKIGPSWGDLKPYEFK
jgi:DNA polymerase I-like protein with 3'-5' exonuclease and polymerase domains